MKKTLFLATLAVFAFVFTACDGGSNPDVVNTKLFPAMDASGDKWGYINEKGEMVLPAIYDKALNFTCGYALVETDYISYFIDDKGNKQEASFDSAMPFYYNYSVVFLNNRFGLLGTNFDFAIEPSMVRLGTMGDNGLVCAKREDGAKWEYVNAKGETKIDAEFDGADNFKGGLAIIYVGDQCGAIDKDGKYLIEPSSQLGLINLGEGLVANYDFSAQKWSVLDKNGKTIVEPTFNDINAVSDGLIAVSGDNGCGFLNTKGEMVIPEMYAQVRSFSEGYAWVTESHSGPFKCIDKKNNEIFSLNTGDTPTTDFLNGLALVQTSTGGKYVGTDGQVIYEWGNN